MLLFGFPPSPLFFVVETIKSRVPQNQYYLLNILIFVTLILHAWLFMTNLNSPPLIYVEVSGFREEVSIMRGGGGHLCVYKLPLKPVIGLRITHSALHFNATRRASSPVTSVCPRSCKCTLSDFWPRSPLSFT